MSYELTSPAPRSSEELITWVRHGKVKKLKESLAQLPNRAFDATGVRMPFVEGMLCFRCLLCLSYCSLRDLPLTRFDPLHFSTAQSLFFC